MAYAGDGLVSGLPWSQSKPVSWTEVWSLATLHSPESLKEASGSATLWGSRWEWPANGKGRGPKWNGWKAWCPGNTTGRQNFIFQLFTHRKIIPIQKYTYLCSYNHIWYEMGKVVRGVSSSRKRFYRHKCEALNFDWISSAGGAVAFLQPIIFGNSLRNLDAILNLLLRPPESFIAAASQQRRKKCLI